MYSVPGPEMSTGSYLRIAKEKLTLYSPSTLIEVFRLKFLDLA